MIMFSEPTVTQNDMPSCQNIPIENIVTGGAKGIFTGGQAHRLYQGSVQNGPQYRRGCVSRL